MTFTIVDDAAQDEDGNWICTSGGQECVEQWISDQMYSVAQY